MCAVSPFAGLQQQRRHDPGHTANLGAMQARLLGTLGAERAAYGAGGPAWHPGRPHLSDAVHRAGSWQSGGPWCPSVAPQAQPLPHGSACRGRTCISSPGPTSKFNASAQVTFTFWGVCGTSLIYQSDALPDEVDVTVCSLDDPNAVPTRDHTQAVSGVK
jgi:hypothetical protein